MKSIILLSVLLFSFELAVTAQQPHATSLPLSSVRPAPTPTARRSSLPLVFEPNRGQTNKEVRYLSRGSGYTLFLTDQEAVMASPGRPPVRMSLAGSNAPKHIEAMEPTGGMSNYLLGNDPAKWRTDIPQYRKVRYEGVYPGVDEVFYGNNGKLEYDLIVAPGADPSQITMEYDGPSSLGIDDKGDLILTTDSGNVRMQRPTVYQVDAHGERTPVEAAFRLKSPKRATFILARYDTTRKLTIDPSVAYVTYLGGSAEDTAAGIAIDSAGNAYITGYASSGNFPTKNPLQASGAGAGDAFVSKINAAGTGIIYSTYLGGSGQDNAYAIAVDASGDAYIAGSTGSKNFPVQNPLQPVWKGTKGPAFVAKLNPSGNGFIYSTFLGGSSGDSALGIAADAAGNAYVTGFTYSSDFPVANAIQSTFTGLYNGFATKISADGSSLMYSTYLIGGQADQGAAVAVDASGNAYLTGTTGEGTGAQAYILKLSATGSKTYLAGFSSATGNGVAVDAAGEAYMVGSLASLPGFKQTNALFPNLTGQNAFIGKINAAGTAPIYSTLFAAASAKSVAVDAAGNAYVTGSGASATAFPIKDAIQPTQLLSQDAFVTVFNPTGSALLYSTYLGGGGNVGAGIAVDGQGNAYVAGYGADLPSDPSAFQPSPDGATNAFVIKLSSSSTDVATVSAASFLPGIAVTPNSIAAAFGNHLATQTATASGTLGTTLGGTTVNVTDGNSITTPAQIFYASAGQVNFLIPAGIATGQGQVQITAADGTVSVGSLSIATIAPGIFTADGKVPVGSVLQITAQGSQSTTNLAQYNSATGVFSAPINLGASGTSTYLIIYGTGIRNALLSQTSIKIGNQTVTPAFAGIQGTFAGLDQVNVLIPYSLAGSGDIAITLTAGGITSNAVHVTIQ